MKQKTKQPHPSSSRAAVRPHSASRNRHRGQRPTLRRVPRQARSVFVTLLATLPLHAYAEDTTTVLLEPKSLDHIWNHATLYKDELNPILQEFKLRGRYQGQYWDVDADQGSQSDWEDRRARIGFDAKLFDQKVEVRADFQSNDGFEDVYDGLVDAYLRWKPKVMAQHHGRKNEAAHRSL